MLTAFCSLSARILLHFIHKYNTVAVRFILKRTKATISPHSNEKKETEEEEEEKKRKNSTVDLFSIFAAAVAVVVGALYAPFSL